MVELGKDNKVVRCLPKTQSDCHKGFYAQPITPKFLETEDSQQLKALRGNMVKILFLFHLDIFKLQGFCFTGVSQIVVNHLVFNVFIGKTDVNFLP